MPALLRRSLLCCLLALLLPIVPTTVAAAGTPDYALPDGSGHFYQQANGQGGQGDSGFAITNDDGLPFWTAYQQLGGPPVLGYPISGRFVWNGFTVQAMQKVILQWQPETKSFAFVNVLDQLHDLGTDGWLQVYRQTPPPLSTAADSGLTFDQVAQRHLAILAANPSIQARYLSDPAYLAHFGLPMSAADEGNSFVVRCQRAVFQFWKVDVHGRPTGVGAKSGDVTIANGGDLAKDAGILPGSAVTPELPPGSSLPPTPTCATLPIRGFGAAWAAHPEIYDLLGCPGYPSNEAAITVSMQRFQHGWMLLAARPAPYYGSPPAQVYALFDDNETFAAFPNTYVAGTDAASSGLTPPAGLLEPQGAFGKVWREGTGAQTQQRLGWATAPAQTEQGAWQTFQRGEMVWTPNPKMIFVLAERTPHGDILESWRSYPDTFLS